MRPCNETARMIALGQIICTVRETGRAPKTSQALKAAGINTSASQIRKFDLALRECRIIGDRPDGTQFLYKDGRMASELVPMLMEHLKNMDVPAPRKYVRASEKFQLVLAKAAAAVGLSTQQLLDLIAENNQSYGR